MSLKFFSLFQIFYFNSSFLKFNSFVNGNTYIMLGKIFLSTPRDSKVYHKNNSLAVSLRQLRKTGYVFLDASRIGSRALWVDKVTDNYILYSCFIFTGLISISDNSYAPISHPYPLYSSWSYHICHSY